MPHFYKAAVKATAVGQDITNVLYYAPLIPTESAFDEAEALALGDAIGDAWASTLLPNMPTQYALQSVEMSQIDETGAVTSPYTVSAPASGAGASGGVINTAAQCLIYKFNCAVVPEAPGHFVPRRSYIAIGPLVDAFIDPDGSLLSRAAWQVAMDAVATQGHLISGTQFVAYRVGRNAPPSTEDPDGVVAGVGRVVSGIVRPFTSFRTSRKKTPSGR